MSARRLSDDELAGTIRAAEAALAAQAGLSSPLEYTVDVPGARVRVLEFEGRTDVPPLLVLHGIASVTAAAMPLLGRLGGRRIIAVDWPGHGLSTPFEIAPRGAVRAHAVGVIDAVVRSFDLERFDLVGHSMGGQFALYSALANQGRVRTLTLLGAPGAGMQGVDPVLAFRVMSIPGVGRWMLSRPTTLERYRADSRGLLGDAAVAASAEPLIQAGHAASSRSGFARSLASFFRAMITPFAVHRDVAVPPAELAKLAMPVLAVWGQRDVFLRPANARESLDAIPELTLVITAGGHAPWLDEPDLVAETVLGFLDRP